VAPGDTVSALRTATVKLPAGTPGPAAAGGQGSAVYTHAGPAVAGELLTGAVDAIIDLVQHTVMGVPGEGTSVAVTGPLFRYNPERLLSLSVTLSIRVTPVLSATLMP
jgi:hypothetical protein